MGQLMTITKSVEWLERKARQEEEVTKLEVEQKKARLTLMVKQMKQRHALYAKHNRERTRGK